MSNKSVFGLEENIAAALSNATFGLFGVAALIKERDNRFVRFHAMQSVITFFGLGIVQSVLSLLTKIFSGIPLLGWMLSMPMGMLNFAVGFITMAAWVYLSYTAYKGSMVKVPLVGDAVLRQLDK